MTRSRKSEDVEKWETPSLEWIHRIRREMVERGETGPMPLAKQKALAKKYGSKLVFPPTKSRPSDAKFTKAAARILKKNAALYERLAKCEKWETPSLEWIHRVRADHARRRKGILKPMPLARQKALAKKYGLKLVSARKKAEIE